MKHFDADSTAKALEFPALIDALKSMFITSCEVPLRTSLTVGDDLTSLLMPAWRVVRYLGSKVVNIAPRNATRGRPGLFSTYVLSSSTTGEPPAQMQEALLKSRDLLQAVQDGTLAPSEVCGTLEQLCRFDGHHHSPDDRTVFKSVGTALEDLAAAILVYESV